MPGPRVRSQKKRTMRQSREVRSSLVLVIVISASSLGANPRRLAHFSAKLKCLFALTVTPRGVVTLEVVLRKGQRLLDRGPYTGACAEAAPAPHASTAHRAAPPSLAATGRHLLKRA